MTADLVVRNSVAVADPNSPSHVIKPNADGSVNVTGVSGTFEATEKNTAADPSYTEGTVNPLSGTLAGYLRVIANLFQIGGTSILTGTGAQGAGSPRVTVAVDSATVAGSAAGTAGTPSASVVSVQGVSGGTGVTSNVTQVGGTNVSTGTGAQGAGAQRITVATDTATVAGSATLPAGSNTIGKIDILGNAGGILDATLAAGTAPANGVGNLGQYLNNAGQLSLTSSQTGSIQTDPAGNLRTAPQRPVAGDILDGFQSFLTSTAATTLVTVPAGRTWIGVIAASCSCLTNAGSTAGGQARAVFTTAGTNVTPAAATVFAVHAMCGANAATGTVGSQAAVFGALPLTVVAPAGNSVTVQVAAVSLSGTATIVDASASGVLQ